MRLPTTTAAATALLLPTLVAASAWDCLAVQDGLQFDFTSLAGKHELYDVLEHPPSVTNTTWQINPCGFVSKTKEEHPKDQCPNGTQGPSLSLAHRCTR